ncbi:alpha/beta hydrolase [Corynebacterium tapiri]|uniref:Alpha/beta hydrolase n=1 Tax=Corynebacterium tapiri TaxID=1448266 RepID=A0A5C4U530_9CORY|nr:alpha/beta hydrolase [Corynebacterium tapiri]TNL99279.1 alpha/beta hydrolase [Corynebacterium tapiri]
MNTHDFHPDILGPDFGALTLELGKDPEGEGDIYATLVRYTPSVHHRKAVLWIPGMTDYFFHDHVARELDKAGYSLYGIDLRKCGRSRRAGQRWHYSEDFTRYFQELNLAVEVMSQSHDEITPLAHSTGGLIAALWLNQHPHPAIGKAVLNSPWLDMMYPAPVVAAAKVLTSALGKRWPGLEIPGGGLSTYGESLKDWDFDRALKPTGGHAKTIGWLRAVLRAQHQVHQGQVDVGVPLLTLTSSRSYLGKPYSAAADTADVVLDVEQIWRWAPTLSADSQIVRIDGARHDVFLSTEYALRQALDATVSFLDE